MTNGEAHPDYQMLVQTIPQLVWVTTAKGIPVYFNPQWLDYTAFSVTEDLEANWTSLLHPEDRAPAAAAWTHAVETGEPFEIEYRLRRHDGVFHWFLVRGLPIRDETGQIARWVGTCTDIDRAKHEEAENARAHLAAIVRSSADGIVSKDLTGIVTSWNPAAERIYGYTAQEMIGRSKAIVIPPELPEELSTMLRKIRAGEQIEHYETIRIRKDGTRINLSISVSPIRDSAGRIIGASTIARDITERVQHLHEIQALNARLQRAIQETHHRVKNNLQIMAALAELQTAEGNETVPVSALNRMGQHTRSLAAIHDLLVQGIRVDRSTDRLSTRDLLDRLIALLRDTSGGRPIVYEADDFIVPVREGSSLALLVSELVSNAVKHGAGTITLSLRAGDGLARLEVTDEGAGFAEDFDPQQAANIGLGLTESVGRYDLGGTLVFDNKPSGGGRVQVVFPMPALD